MKRIFQFGALLLAGTSALSCARLTVDPIEVKTIHIQHDINLHVDQQIEDFFAYQERAAATQPTTQAASSESKPQGVAP